MSKSLGLREALIALLLLALILVPRSIAGYLDLSAARRFEAAGDSPAAASAYAGAARRLPWQPGLWEQAGLLALAAGDAQTAVQHFQHALAANALTQAGWIGLGDAYQQEGDGPSAVSAWEHALHDFAPSADACIRLGGHYRRLGDLQAALALYRQAASLTPQDARPHYQVGLILLAERPDEALPELIQAARLDPGLDAAVQHLRTAVNTAADSDDLAYRSLIVGRALGALSEWDLAEKAFRQAIDSNPRYAEAWAWLAEARQQRGLDGGPGIQQALALNPDQAMVQGLYGLYLQRQGWPQEAMAAFLKAAAREPYDPGWRLALASASEQGGDLVAALAYLDHAMELAPGSPSVWQARASFSLRNNIELTTTGLEAARRLVTLKPDDWQSLDLAGQILMETGDLTGAELLLKKALGLAPTRAEPALHLALLYLQTGNSAGAFSFLQQARVFDPHGASGEQAGQLLERYFP